MVVRLVVLGGMHGGAWIAARLKKTFRSAASVTFIAPYAELPVLPSLTRSLADDRHVHIMNFRHELSHLGVHVYSSRLVEHVPEEKLLILDHLGVRYDALIVDPDVYPSMSVPGARDHAFTFVTQKELFAFKRHVDATLRRGMRASGEERQACLTLCVVGHTVQAIEAAYALALRARRVLNDSGLRARVLLCTDVIPGESVRAAVGVVRMLSAAGVEVRASTVDRVLSSTAVLSDDDRVACETVLWLTDWRVKGPRVAGPGVRVLSEGAPYWPMLGVEEAHDATRWVSAYLSGKPLPPPLLRRLPLLRLHDSVYAVTDRLRGGPLQRMRYFWRLRRYVHL